MARLTLQEQISATQALFTASYDLISGGMPHHAFMLDELVAGRALNRYGKATFLSLDGAGLLQVPGLTYRPSSEFAEKAKARIAFTKAYLGEELEQYISGMKERLAEMLTSALQGSSAAVRRFFKPDSHQDEPLSLEELTGILNQLKSEGRSLDRSLPEQGIMGSPPAFYTGLTVYVMSDLGTLSFESIEIFDQVDALWFTGALFEAGINLHISKLELMTRIFQHAVERCTSLGFADISVFEPEKYFSGAHREVPKTGWETAFQRNFGRPAPSAIGLLDWTNSALAAAKAKYLGAEAAKT